MMWTDTFYEAELPQVDRTARMMLKALKAAFCGASASNFCFPKFHHVTHVAEQIKWHGALWSSDSARFEFFHKAAAKIPYQNSSKRTDSFVIEMLSYQRYLCKLNHALALLRAEQPAKPANAATI